MPDNPGPSSGSMHHGNSPLSSSQSQSTSNIPLNASTQSKGPAERKKIEGKRARRLKYAEDASTGSGRLQVGDSGTLRAWSSSANIYQGSYARSSYRSRSSVDLLSGAKPPAGSVPPSPRVSLGHDQLAHLLENIDVDLDTYGLEESRDGFFDALFFRPAIDNDEKLLEEAQAVEPSFGKYHPLSLRQAIPRQFHGFISSLRRIGTTRSGVKLAKSFLGYFVAYIICLIPMSGKWLGPDPYIIAISVLVNHPGRAMGSQIDGAILTTLGTAAGLAWGSLALYVSTSTVPAQRGYGGVLATFLIMFTAVIAWLRCVFLRFYQAAISAGIAICYTCLAGTSQDVGWRKIFHYGVPWVLGQAIGLVVSFVIFPEAGSRSVATALHGALNIVKESLVLPRPDDPKHRRDLAWNFVHLSQAYRDLAIEISITRYNPEDVKELRNLVQGMIRSALAFETDTKLFGVSRRHLERRGEDEERDAVIDVASTPFAQLTECRMSSMDVGVSLVSQFLAEPTRALIDSMVKVISSCDAVLMDLSGLREYRIQQPDAGRDLSVALRTLRNGMARFDEADASLVNHPNLPATYSDHPEIVELFLFVHPIRQAADSVEAFAAKVIKMQNKSNRLRIYLPSYPWSKSLSRSNEQVRHDRGGLTAGFYFRSKQQLEKTLEGLQSTVYKPLPRDPIEVPTSKERGDKEEEGDDLAPAKAKGVTLRYRIWTILHRLQDFETRFAFKCAVLTTLLSIPAWLQQSRNWWNRYECWWVVVTVWLMMHPRVGGNFQDLVTRTTCALLGAVWGGLSYGAAKGNPYVMAAFCAIFMIPFMYRFSQSSHPRSGVIGCISFTVVSLSAYQLRAPVIQVSWTRGAAFLVGVMSAVVVNWVLWPFVARHELRKSLSSMMLHMSVVYRGVIARYVYYDEGHAPSEEDVKKSEVLEGQLREGFVRMRQLMELTQHEIRLRGTFNPVPHSALIDACERFFDHLVELRLSSLYFQPFMHAGNPEATQQLITARRDAVASILVNLYILAGALRADRPVPRYLPSAAAARKKLLDRMMQVELELSLGGMKEPKRINSRRWADVYQYAYSTALTDIVEQLEQLQKYTKAITGEVGFDLPAE